MFGTLYNRIQFACTVICEHKQKQIRDADNDKMFELPHKDQIKMMQTVTNVLNLKLAFL